MRNRRFVFDRKNKTLTHTKYRRVSEKQMDFLLFMGKFYHNFQESLKMRAEEEWREKQVEIR